ncbi:MAG: O-antigen ligase family protein [Ahrensia sp.]|nr:O-antigen ligase family protein [Ahrensia sp.]
MTIVLTTLYALYFIISNPDIRLGFGTNPVIAAYWLMILGSVSRMQFNRDEAPITGCMFFYLSAIPLVATGSKISLFFLLLVAVFDTINFLRFAFKNLSSIKTASFIFIACVLVAIGFAGTTQLAIFGRMETLIGYVSSGGLVQDESSMLRLALWDLGWQLFLDNPIFGYGSCSIEQVIPAFIENETGLERKYVHLHNLIVDEIAGRGIVGLTLFFGLFYCIFSKLLQSDKFSTIDKNTIGILLAAIFIYSLTGSHQTDGRMISLTIFTFGILLAEQGRREQPELFAETAS